MSEEIKTLSEIKYDITPDPNKSINSVCSCKKGLQWVKCKVYMAYPCEHLYHDKCFDEIMNGNKICKLCKLNNQDTIITKKITLLDKDIHYQRFADILSMTNYDDMCQNTPIRFLDSLFDITSLFIRLPFANNINEGRKICEDLFALNNLTLKVYGMNKIKHEKNKVYICNHVSHLELVVLYYLFDTAFLSSSAANSESPVMKKVSSVVPMITFNRGDKNKKINIVDEMRNYVDTKGSICLFPEGLMKHPDTLVRFRTGAFHINRPLYAITIKHNDIVCDTHFNGFFYKLGAKKNITMEVHVLGPYYPPFSDNDIEKIRMDMAKHGNMILSRVTNRDIVDK